MMVDGRSFIKTRKSKVPQGSILGPYDLPSTIMSQLLEFADDTKYFRQIISLLDIQKLQKGLNSFFNWSINNHLSFNFSKFVLMSFHRKFNSQYIINDHIINESSSCKDLRIIFTNTLSWRKHYEMISSKVYKSLGLLRRVFKESQCPHT